MKCDELKQVENPIEWGLYYDKSEVDAAIAELKDKIQMHDFFWEGCGFAKRGFKNTIAVSEAFDRLEAENAELKQKLEDVNELIKTARKMLEDAKATHYAEMVDAGMENRRLKRALWLARAERAKYRVEYWTCRGGTLLEHYPFCVNGDSPFNRLSEMGCLYGDTNERLKEAKFKHLYASEWMLVWENVERKCRAKAEEA